MYKVMSLHQDGEEKLNIKPNLNGNNRFIALFYNVASKVIHISIES